MAELLADRVLRAIGEVSKFYNRLVLIVGPAGSSKTSVLKKVSESTSASVTNANLELSRRMLDLTERQRALLLPRLFAEIVQEATRELPGTSYAGQTRLALIDNIELLFDPRLKQDPLRLLQGSSRNQTIVAAWNGAISSGHITYAVPGHPEYRRYPIRDFLAVGTSELA